jgi:hypothetical protein
VVKKFSFFHFILRDQYWYLMFVVQKRKTRILLQCKFSSIIPVVSLWNSIVYTLISNGVCVVYNWHFMLMCV